MKYEAGLHSNKIKKFVRFCVRAKGCMQGESGLNQIIWESILHEEGQAQYVERVLQGVVGVDPVCMDRSI